MMPIGERRIKTVASGDTSPSWILPYEIAHPPPPPPAGAAGGDAVTAVASFE
jgi:serine/threonine protein kinase HipA of HipAB toxin-antitoxin module